MRVEWNHGDIESMLIGDAKAIYGERFISARLMVSIDELAYLVIQVKEEEEDAKNNQ